MSGYSLMTAGEMDLKDASMMDYLKDNKEFNILNSERKKHPDIFTISAAFMLLVGVVLSLVMKKYREQTAVIISAIVIAILLIFRGMMLYQWEKQIGAQPEMFSFIKLSINFAIGYWLVVIGNAFVMTLNGYYLFQKKKMQENISDFHDHQSPDTLEEL
jgi:predicted histidine transporter YuiF (NhaC family)